MYEKMLVAVDGSDHAKGALGATAELARLAGSEVRVVHVVELGYAGRLGPYLQEEPEEARVLVDQAVAELGEAGVKATGSLPRVLGSNAAAEIVAEAEDLGASLIVMGSRGRSDLTGLVMGSVSHKVLHLAPCPVLIVR
ncbi:MAG TPA: universal stress protein [Acidimicrobiales bacterium]|jgi:nucleotide-binding universal stress UspA family protein|nr:universal stress protein [Acidimicrobiales bacterium]